MTDTVYFKPESDLTFKTVASIRVQLYQALSDPKSTGFCLDLANVHHCDSSGLALLIEAKKLCQRSHKSFRVEGISAETQSLAEFCGVQSFLETS